MIALHIFVRQGGRGAVTGQWVWSQSACLRQVRRPAPARARRRLPRGPPHAWTAAPKDFSDFAGSITAGANEIQRNIMAKAVLGL
jgi:hypothetical protein